jgi:uncharacterized SAM-binding protein YcdF (DUF218 family)
MLVTIRSGYIGGQSDGACGETPTKYGRPIAVRVSRVRPREDDEPRYVEALRTVVEPVTVARPNRPDGMKSFPASSATVGNVRTAIVVLGNGGRRRGSTSITPACLELVRETEHIVASQRVDVVVFTGGARGGGPSEAEQMRVAWEGPVVELVVEPTASITAENAARTLPLLLQRGIERAVVVCAPLHVYRTRFFFSRLFEPHGIQTSFHVAAVEQGARAFAWEIAAAPLCRRQLRAARAELVQRGYA